MIPNERLPTEAGGMRERGLRLQNAYILLGTLYWTIVKILRILSQYVTNIRICNTKFTIFAVLSINLLYHRNDTCNRLAVFSVPSFRIDFWRFFFFLYSSTMALQPRIVSSTIPFRASYNPEIEYVMTLHLCKTRVNVRFVGWISSSWLSLRLIYILGGFTTPPSRAPVGYFHSPCLFP